MSGAPPIEERLWSRVVLTESGCWEWTGFKSGGYGRIRYQGATMGAHRAAYLLLVGEIPEGLQLDHLCRNRACVNPDHLEPVTPRINTLRGVSLQAQNAAKTHCAQGHPFSGDNLVVRVNRTHPNGHRVCRTCERQRHWGDGIPNAAKTHCKNGHAFDDGNTYRTNKGQRQCRACNREAAARYKARRSAA